MAGAAVSLSLRPEKSNCPFRMRCINSIPEIVVAALLNRLKPSITFVLDLMFRWSCSIRLALPYAKCRSPAGPGETADENRRR